MTREVSSGRAIGLIRVSTDKQAESGLGLEAQQASITACATRLHLPLVTVYLEGSRTMGTSGSLAIANRPVLLEAIAALKRGDTLLVAKRDRIGRDVIAVAMIERLVTKRGSPHCQCGRGRQRSRWAIRCADEAAHRQLRGVSAIDHRGTDETRPSSETPPGGADISLCPLRLCHQCQWAHPGLFRG